MKFTLDIERHLIEQKSMNKLIKHTLKNIKKEKLILSQKETILLQKKVCYLLKIFWNNINLEKNFHYKSPLITGLKTILKLILKKSSQNFNNKIHQIPKNIAKYSNSIETD